MVQTVNPPVVTMASPAAVPVELQNSAVNQQGIASFSAVLALLGHAPAELPLTAKPLLAETGEGKDLPLESLVSGNSGDLLPPAVQVDGDGNVQLGVNVLGAQSELPDDHSVIPGDQSITAVLATMEQPESTPDGVVAPVIRASSPVEIPEARSFDGNDTVPIAEGGAGLALNPANRLPVQPEMTSRQPAIHFPVHKESAVQEVEISSQPLRESLARIQLQMATTAHNRDLPVTTQSHLPDGQDNGQDIPELPVQLLRGLPENMAKAVIHPAAVDTIRQNLRQLAVTAPGVEIRNNPDTSSMFPSVQSSPLTPAQSSIMHPLPSLTLDTPFQKAAWDQGVTDKIQWMVGQKLQGAEIKLNPEHLGPITVKIQMQNDQASVQFTATHGVVRDALEAAVPRLREMLDNQGIQLADVDVSEHSFAQQQKDKQAGSTPSVSRSTEADQQQIIHEEDSGKNWTTPVAVAGSVDLFA